MEVEVEVEMAQYQPQIPPKWTQRREVGDSGLETYGDGCGGVSIRWIDLLALVLAGHL